jgi:DNA-binding IclR family transcriptional regulator
MCAACRGRYGAVPPVPVAVVVAPGPVVAEAVVSRPRAVEREDRLRRALRELPRGAHSVGQIAKAAGLNQDKTLSRLQGLEAAGEVRRVGRRWTSEPPSTDVEAAFDRLQARTSNLRIIRDREPVA